MAGIHGLYGQIHEVVPWKEGLKTTKTFWFRMNSDNVELKNKIVEFLRWAKTRGYLDVSVHPDCPLEDPVLREYYNGRKNSSQNINVDPLEIENNKTISIEELIETQHKRGRPKGSTTKIVRRGGISSGRKGKSVGRPRKAASQPYQSTGRPRGRPRKDGLPAGYYKNGKEN